LVAEESNWAMAGMVATAREEKNLMKTMKEGMEQGEETKKVKGWGR